MLVKESKLPWKLVVDNFAGGGGTATGLEIGLGRPVEVAINHNAPAVAMHRLNHPSTKHYCEDVYHVNPREVANGRPVGLVWLSPDCTHHSQAAGGQPRDNVIRGLAWVGREWAGMVLPDVIMLENVVQILQWGPLVCKRDKATGRAIRLDKTVALPGERVKVQDQFLVPDKKHLGRTWKAFVHSLQELGYTVEWRKLCAADYGAPTTRERLFMVARRDGNPIVWPQPTHFKKPVGNQPKWRAASECIDWSIPCPSIFARKRDLVAATLRRVARGIQRYVIDSGDPFIVPIAHYNGSNTVHDINEPLRTISSPVPTVTTGNHHAVVSACLASYYTDDANRCRSMQDPAATVTTENRLGLIAASMVQTGYGEREGQLPRSQDIDQPLSTVVDGACKHAVIEAQMEYQLTPDDEAGALRVAEFMFRQQTNIRAWYELSTRQRLELVTVNVKGVPHVIVDIGLRMLTPRELFNAQGFPTNYVIDHGAGGVIFSKSTQVKLVGNSVSPVIPAALARANCADMIVTKDMTIYNWQKVA